MNDIDYSQFSVLIVDDVPLNLLLVDKMLTRFKFKTRKASSGQKALDAVAEEKPDLILLDLMMPGIDGFEVLSRLRNNEDTKDLHIVILSALNSDNDIVKGFKAGANDFITKPILMDRLVACVETQIKEIVKQREVAKG